MAQQPIRFDDGAGYERMMAVWSRAVGQIFLDWLSPAAGQRWIDVGCGNGAFTELLIQRCAPGEVQGIDPSEAQLTFARSRPSAGSAAFLQGDAMALPFDAGRFDAAVMALVIFFVPEPAKGVGEMTRVTRPGGLVAAYAWDALGGGSPTEPILAEMIALGLPPVLPPSASASRIEALRGLWTDAGLAGVETHEITCNGRSPASMISGGLWCNLKWGSHKAKYWLFYYAASTALQTAGVLLSLMRNPRRSNWPLWMRRSSSMPAMVIAAVLNHLKPSIGPMRSFTPR